MVDTVLIPGSCRLFEEKMCTQYKNLLCILIVYTCVCVCVCLRVLVYIFNFVCCAFYGYDYYYFQPILLFFSFLCLVDMDRVV